MRRQRVVFSKRRIMHELTIIRVKKTLTYRNSQTNRVSYWPMIREIPRFLVR